MSDVGEMVSTAEPLAASFSTVLEFTDELPAVFLAEFIGALHACAVDEGYLLVLAEASSGSIVMRWKLAVVATFSASGLAVAANAATVTDFMGKVISAIVSQPADAASLPPSQAAINQTIMAGLRDGTITSITLRQKGGRSVRIDATQLPAVVPKRPVSRGAGFGSPPPTQVKSKPYGRIPTSQIEGRIILADRNTYFQPAGSSKFFPIRDKRIRRKPIAEGKYVARGYVYKDIFFLFEVKAK